VKNMTDCYESGVESVMVRVWTDSFSDPKTFSSRDRQIIRKRSSEINNCLPWTLPDPSSMGFDEGPALEPKLGCVTSI